MGLPASDALSAPSLIGAAQHLFDRVHHRPGEALFAPVLAHRDTFDVAAPQRDVPVQQPSLHHRGVCDQRAMVADQRVHAAERVFPVGVGELAAEGVDDHSPRVLARFVVQIGRVDQACGVDAGSEVLAGVSGTDIVRVHTVVLPARPRAVCTKGYGAGAADATSASAPSGRAESVRPCRCRDLRPLRSPGTRR